MVTLGHNPRRALVFLVTLATAAAALLWLPSTLAWGYWPLELGALSGALCWGLLMRRGPVVAGTLLATVIQLGALALWGVEATSRGHFDLWVPLLGWLALLVFVVGSGLERLRPAARPWITATLVGLALGAGSLATGHYVSEVLRGDSVRAWNLYHYYLGAKYFDDVGYHGLYEASLAADQDWQEAKQRLPAARRDQLDSLGDMREVQRVHDMRTYRRISRQEAVRRGRAMMPAAHRLELGQDLRRLARWEDAWTRIFGDWGFNPAPPWMVIGTPLARWLPLEGSGLWLLANSDLPLLLLAVGALGWGWGLRAGAVGALYLVTIQFNHGRLTGGMLQYDWLASALLGLAFYRRGWPVAGGVSLAWAAMTRLFPGLFIFPVLASLGWRWWRGGRLGRDRVRFVLAFCLACAALLVASNFTGRGLQTWPEWREKISLHTERHAFTSDQRLGVGRLAVHAPRPGHPWASVRGSLSKRLAYTAPRRHAWQLIGMLVLLPALLRRREQDAMVLMLFAGFLFAVASRYYGSIWMLLAVLGLPSDPRQPQSAPGVAATGLLLVLPPAFYLVSDRTGAYYLLNYIVFFGFVGICMGYLAFDLGLLGRGLGPAEALVRPWSVGLFNLLTPVARALGLLRFDAKLLLRQAAAAEGVPEDDASDVREGLEVLCESLEHEVRLSLAGRVAQHQDLVRALRLRLRRRSLPHDAPLRPPLIVTGLPRSGTTYLHRLLALDPASHALPLWQLREILPPPGPDRRHAEAELVVNRLRRIAPELDAKHLLAADAPEECTLLFDSTLWGMTPWRLVPCFAHLEWVLAQDPLPYYVVYRQLLAAAQAATPKQRLVLKNPDHVGFIDTILAVIPDAMVVQTHREPTTIIASYSSLMDSIHQALTHQRDPARASAAGLELWASLIDRNLACRERLPAGRLFDLSYRTLVAEPVASVRRVYAHFGLDFSQDFELALKEAVANRPQHKHGKHHYALEDYGLSEAQVATRFSAYRSRFIEP